MAKLESGSREMEEIQVDTAPRKPRILLAASGSVAAIKFGNLRRSFAEWAEVKAVAPKASLHFIDRASLPKDVVLYTDEEEWSSWKMLGDSVLHIELRRWADIMVIAPLSANTLGKIAGGLCDNLVTWTCIVRAWDYSKPVFVAPSTNTLMWKNPFTERHLMAIDELGISLIPLVTKRLACGDYGNGAMAKPCIIYSTVGLFFQSRPPELNNELLLKNHHIRPVDSAPFSEANMTNRYNFSRFGRGRGPSRGRGRGRNNFQPRGRNDRIFHQQ